MTLSKEAILSVEDKIIEEVNVPEWGGLIYLKSITGSQRDKYEAAIVDMKGKDPKIKLEDLKVRLLVLCIVDADGRECLIINGIEMPIDFALKYPEWFNPVTIEEHLAICKNNTIKYIMDMFKKTEEEATVIFKRHYEMKKKNA